MPLICTLRVGVRLIPLNREGSWGPDTVEGQLLNIESCHLCARQHFTCLTVFEGGMFPFDLQRRKWRLQEGKWVLPPMPLVAMGRRISSACLQGCTLKRSYHQGLGYKGCVSFPGLW